MKTNVFSNETLNAAVKAMNESQAEIAQLRMQIKTEPIADVVQHYMIDNLTFTQSEAEEVYNEICQGIAEFDNQLVANAETGKANLRIKLEDVTKDMPEADKVQYLGGILTAFQLAEQNLKQEEVTAIIETNTKRTAEELIAEIETAFNGKISVEALAEFVDKNVDAQSVIELAEQIGMSKDEYRILASTILYVNQQNGSVKLSDEPIPASMLGSLVGAGVETIQLTADLKEGKIDLKRWQTVLKWILGAMLTCTLGFIAVGLATFLAGTISYSLLTLLGTSFLAIIAASVITFYVCWNLSERSFSGIVALLGVLSGLYDQYIEPTTQKIMSWVKALKTWAVVLVEKMKGKVTDVTESTHHEEEVDATEAIVQPNPISVKM